jgi:hypothetical protein
MEQYPWFDRLNEALKIYYAYVLRFHSIVNEDAFSYKKRICDLKLLMINFSEDLLDAERKVLDQQFPFAPAVICEAQDKFMAGSVYCSIILN